MVVNDDGILVQTASKLLSLHYREYFMPINSFARLFFSKYIFFHDFMIFSK